MRSAVDSASETHASGGARHTHLLAPVGRRKLATVYEATNQWHRIFDANRNIMDNPDRIFPDKICASQKVDNAKFLYQ
jgi:hypothetical protein